MVWSAGARRERVEAKLTSEGPAGATTGHRVGVPREEAALTALVREQPHLVLAPASDPVSTVVLLEELEVGVGRPDIVVVRVDLDTLNFRRWAGLRLHNLAEARALGAALEGNVELSSVSAEHTNRLIGRLRDKGWLAGPLTRAIQDSMLIEAKVSHWGVGVHQLARVLWASNHAALLVPSSTALRVPTEVLRFNQIGLLTEDGGRLSWAETAPRRELPRHLDAWLAELALRAVERV